MNLTKIFSLCILTLCANTLWAQTDLKGRLTDDKSKPLEFATVMLLQVADSALVKGAISDSAGNYMLPQVKAGNYLLSASMMGYSKAWAGPITVGEAGNKALPALQLTEMEEQLKAVTVVGQRPMVVQEADRMIVNVEGSILADGGTALEVLEKSPGISVDQDGNISLNGKQGVTVMIDGKRTYLSSADIASMLKNMPSDALTQVELITNPSAKYDAAGNAGIINIKTKKGKSDGTNGSLTLGAGYGRFEKMNGGLTLNHRRGIMNAFGSYNINMNRGFQDLKIDRRAVVDNEANIFDQHGYMPNEWRGHSFKAGVDLFLDSKNTLGVMVNGRTGNWSSASTNTALHSIEGLGRQRIITTLGDFEERSSNLTLNLNYQRTFDTAGKELSFDVDYLAFKNTDENVFDNRFQYFSGRADSVFMLRSAAPAEIDIWVAKLDYTLPVGKGKVETGAKASYVNSDNDAKIEKQEDELSWNVWDKFTNDFLYKENISAAYANWSGAFGKTTVMAGLRAEHTWYRGESVKNDSTVSNQYVSLFPSLFVQHPLNEKNTVGFSYSRRVDRPSYQDLNPFFDLLDVTTYSKGNPLLQPQFTHQLQLSHTLNQSVVTNLTYSITDGPMTQVIETEELDVFQTQVNMGTLTNWSLNVSVPVTVAKWWNIQNHIGAFHNKYRGTYLEQQLDIDQFSGSLNIMNAFKLPHNLSAELSGFYRTPTVWGTMEAKSMYSVNAGVKYSFWDSNASLKLSANDVLGTMRFRGTSNFANTDISVNNHWESRRVNLSFSYRFGNKDVKPANRKRGASSDEQGRIKSEQN